MYQLKGNNQVKKENTTKDEIDVNKMKAAGRFSGRYNRKKLNVIDAKQNMSHKDAPPKVSRASHVMGRTTSQDQMLAPTQRRTRIPISPMLQMQMNQRRKAQLRIPPKELSHLKG